MNEGLWIATIVGLSGGLLFAVIGAIFAIVNAVTTPIEAITGIPGLIAWNIIAGLYLDFLLISILIDEKEFIQTIKLNLRFENTLILNN